jgi:hypothetical protein
MTSINILIAAAAFFAGLVVREFLPSYLRRKGENLATKEDIAAITELQKAVEHRFNELLEDSKQRHALRLAALDRRLAAHQEAFSLWRELLAGATPIRSVLSCLDARNGGKGIACIWNLGFVTPSYERIPQPIPIILPFKRVPIRRSLKRTGRRS